jgi:hypothetical protein
MPHISYLKSNEISLAQDDRLHVSIDLHPPRVEVRPSVIAPIQGKNMSPLMCSHKIHDHVRSACLQCIADFEAELQNALPELLRQLGWSGEQIKGFLEEEQRSNTNTPLSRLLPKGDGSYEAQECEWQVSLMQEMNRKIKSAETRRAVRRR